MQKIYYILSIFFIILSCKSETKEYKQDETTNEQLIEVSHAKNFTIKQFEGYKVIYLQNAWPGSETVFKYALVEKDGILPKDETFDEIVHVPIQSIVVTSTTHIPSLEMLGVDDKLIGFPNLDYISSKKTRQRIGNNEITELGKNEDINTEALIDLAPDLVVGFAVEGSNKTLTTIKKTGISVIYNGDWTETSPLGKAEWIKFFGALFNKEKEADSIFSEIKTQYLTAKDYALEVQNKPTVLSGAMFKDVWYLPQGNSWAAQLIADANGEYLWKESEGTGSLSLNLETVLEKGQHADFWIGPGYFSSLEQITDAHTVYAQFDAFNNDKVFSFTNKKGETGGVLYFELAPNRPDIVLKDIIKILHPELLPNHELFFFGKLK